MEAKQRKERTTGGLFSILLSVPQVLINHIDRFCAEDAYTSRSEWMRHIIREYVNRRLAKAGEIPKYTKGSK